MRLGIPPPLVGRLLLAGALVLLVPGFVAAQPGTTRVSVGPGAAQGNDQSRVPAISGDGRWVAFYSASSNLVTGDTNGFEDVFVSDVQTGATTRVSVGPGGVQATGANWFNLMAPSISANGRWVAFYSSATNLVAGDTNGVPDVFVHDRETGTTTRVSVGPAGAEANRESFYPAISADGRWVAFDSEATNLVVGDTNGATDVFLHDRQTGTTTRASVGPTSSQGNGVSRFPAISADGRWVTFESFASDLVADDMNGFGDVFVHDRQTATTTRVSVGSGGAQGNGDSEFPRISGDGRWVGFNSEASTLVAGDTNGVPDVFVHDRQTGTTTRESVGPGGAQGNSFSGGPAISADGRWVTFESFSSNLVAGDTNGTVDMFVRDRQTATTTRVSVGPGGAQGNGQSRYPAISADGRWVAFESEASNLVVGDTNSTHDVFVHDRGDPGPTMTLDKTSLRFGAVTTGAAFVSQTAPQIVRLTQTGTGTVTWTATPNQPWLQISPASGSGSATLSISVVFVGGLPAEGTIAGAIDLSFAGASNTSGQIGVSLNLLVNGSQTGPFGFVDTPLDNTTGVTGSIPFTGWALDDIEVTRVSICRDAFGAEVAPVDGQCRRNRQIFVGFAVFIDGSRTDVAALYPSAPLHTRAGWGFMVLTNMLPNQGNGTYQFYMYAHDGGIPTLLGTRTISCANASATKPFGTIDTPDQGGPVSGSSFVNFGWALTPQPKLIPLTGSTISVLVDGADLGTVDYNHERADIEALFPGFQNTAGTNGAVGFRLIDTTTLTNGLHTISWVVIDNQGVADGVGSRFFTVSNGVGAPVTAAPTVEAQATSRGPSGLRRSVPLSSSAHIERLPLDRSALPGRRGWDLAAPLRAFTSSASGRTVIRSEEVSRIELQLGPGRYEGYLRTSEGLSALPAGSRLDADTGEFTWAPGVGFVGAYDLTFVRHVDDAAVSRQEVRIVLQPKGSGLIGPQVVIDIPTSQQDVGQPFVLAGWAADLRATEGTGIATLHAWAYPLTGGAPVFLGVTAYGGTRPDVAAVHGDQFRESGFGLAVQGLAPGHYDLAVFAWSTEANDFVTARLVRVAVRP